MTILLKYWKPILFIILIVALGWLIRDNIAQRKENKRQATNLVQLNTDHQRDLVLTRKEAKTLADESWQHRIDSTAKANGFKPRSIAGATVIQISNRDTGKTDVIHGTPVIIPPKEIAKKDTGKIDQMIPMYQIPVSVDKKCWGMKGVIVTTDPKAQLSIMETNAPNGIDILLVRKRFLGFLWFTKETKVHAYADCGELDITNVTYK